MGELSKLTLNPGGKVTGEMTVDPSVVPLMRENTRIELRNPKLSLSDANISSLLTGKNLRAGAGRRRTAQ
ncbi:mce-related protein [Salmonella enterica subsp. enterica]|uniref:Mce-related protein n=1 Tax=Salmonella enterica I TaxID=59201 RepID=A0A447U1I9_SALET|nr:mce-related protein [Salmonella enterica subsp. enterica]